MAERKTFLLRLDPALHEALQRWAEDEMRSLNGQIEYLLRESLHRAKRTPRRTEGDDAGERPRRR